MRRTALFVEGGGNSRALNTACRQGFRALLENAGFKGRMPRIEACGHRRAAFDRFCLEHSQGLLAYAGLLVDSEDPVADSERTWEHLKASDNWDQPTGALDEQVLLMTTCMETWIVADLETLKQRYGSALEHGSLPPAVKLEERERHSVQDALTRATRNCKGPYEKGKRSFALLTVLDPMRLRERLPSLARAMRILDARL